MDVRNSACCIHPHPRLNVSLPPSRSCEKTSNLRSRDDNGAALLNVLGDVKTRRVFARTILSSCNFRFRPMQSRKASSWRSDLILMGDRMRGLPKTENEGVMSAAITLRLTCLCCRLEKV